MKNEISELKQLIIERNFKGNSEIGGRRISCLKNLRQWSAKTSTELVRTAADKVIRSTTIVNVLKD